MKQKRILLLGGLRYLIPVIRSAHEEGYYVITADYLPNNIAHKYSDQYCNVSIIDKEAVLNCAKRLNIDGIISFAVDPGVITAAYVQEKLGLPTAGPYKSVEILQNKDKFRKFLTQNNFNVPWAKSYSSITEALSDLQSIQLPAIVKPTDSAGSKGVSRIDNYDEYEQALMYAFNHSISGRIIVEEFITQKGCSSDTDCFSVNGELKFVSFSSQRFDKNAKNPYTPSAYSWPSTYSPQEEEELTGEIQRLLTLLQMKTSIYNIETRVGTNGKPYIMEVSPRGGGNRLAEMLHYATGVDLIKNTIRAAVGDSIHEIQQMPYNGHWAEVILHAPKGGKYKGITINPKLNADVIETDIWINEGDQVHDFEGANDAIGTLVLKFSSDSELEIAMSNQDDWLKINIE